MKLLHLHLHLLAVLAACHPQDVVTVTAAPPTPSDEPEWRDDDAFASAVLNSTNTYRGQHGADDVAWNGTLADFADDHLGRADCAFEHSGGPYGENLAIGYPNATASVEAWGDERRGYDFGRHGFSKETGHFTQLVWRNTTDVGCARRLCGKDGRDGYYLVCEYWPRGNVEGQFEQAVGAQEGVSSSLVRAPVAAVMGVVVLCLFGVV